MTDRELEQTLSVLAAKGKDLREAGYTRIAIGDLRLELAEPQPPVPTLLAQPESDKDPLDDPDTFGGGEVPRRRGQGQATEDYEE